MRTLLYIGVIFFAISCNRNKIGLHPGDLLFQAGETSDMTGAITTATGDPRAITFSHVGIALPGSRADSVLEATTDGGVRIVSLKQFLSHSAKIGGHPAVVVMRLRDTTGVEAAVRKARSFLGQPYDYAYRPDNGQMYCSELVWESYLAPDGSPLFRAQPMNFRAPDGTMPEFWVYLYNKIGEPIPEGEPGTNPNDMAKEEILEEIGRYF